jgi:integrase-like protein
VGRPSLSVGTYGSISTTPYGTGYRARTLYRDYDGVTRRVERHGQTKGAAERALRLALRDRMHVGAEAEITPDTKIAGLAETWFAEISAQDRSPGTLRAYRDRLDRQIIPALGNLRVRELTTGIVDRHLRAVREKHGAALGKLCRTAVEMLRLRPHGTPDQTVFCSALGGLRDRDNVIGDLRNALNAAGFEWVTSHTFRRTVATLMDQSGLTARAAADQLGHSHPSLTQDVYYGRRIANTGAADVLEIFG